MAQDPKEKTETEADDNESAADAGEAISSIAENSEKIADEINQAGVFDDGRGQGSLDALRGKRDKIDSEHEGLRGVANYIYGLLGWEPSYSSEIQKLDDAQQYSDQGDAKFRNGQQNQQAGKILQQLRGQMDAAASDETKSDYQRQSQAIDENYARQLDLAKDVTNNKLFYAEGFKNQADANAFSGDIKRDAGAIHDAEFEKLMRARYDEMERGQGRLDVLQSLGAGDKMGAARLALGSELNTEERAIDPKDTERIQQFNKIEQQSLANFDADAARQQKLQESQSNDRVLGYQEEGHEAELRGEGHDDDAKISALKFATEQRVRNLQEEANAEADQTHKAQLLREAKAASGAGAIEQNALQKELARTAQMSNVQAPALAGATQQAGNSAGGRESAGNLSDVSRKLDDAAGKMEKAFANGKTVVILKD